MRYYVDFDDDMFYVVDSRTEKCVSSWCDEEMARIDCDHRNLE